MLGMMIALKLSIQQILDIMIYVGIMVTWEGIISVARYSTNILSRPLNRSRENAYAPMEQVTN